ncbi:unnamed protein product [Arctogadus glacialis]
MYQPGSGTESVQIRTSPHFSHTTCFHYSPEHPPIRPYTAAADESSKKCTFDWTSSFRDSAIYWPRSDDPETLSVVRLQLPLNALQQAQPARSLSPRPTLHTAGRVDTR